MTAMQLVPKSKPGWLALLLFLFRIYSVLGLIAFSLWNIMYYHLQANPHEIYGWVGGWVMVGYQLSAVALIGGGLVQKYVLKSKDADVNILIGAADILILMILPTFFPA